MTDVLLTAWFGAFLVNAKGEVVGERLFPKDVPTLSERNLAIERGEVLEEEAELAKSAKHGVEVLDARLLTLAGATRHHGALPARVARLAKDYGFTPVLMRETAIALGRAKVRLANSKRDQHVVQAVDAIDELASEANLIMERLREWYALHFPELVEKVERHEELAALIASYGTREAIAEKRPEYAIESEMGGPLTQEDEDAIRHLARSASTLYATRAELEKYLDQAMPGIAPNLATLLTPVLAARMIRHAGGLMRLAKMPSGTIQTLGAEKALFRHIKEGKRPPKHGILFQHPALHRAPRHQRGAIARALAAKTALAARADAFTHHDMGRTLIEGFEKREDRVRKEKASPRPRVPSRGGPPARGPPSRGPPPRGAP
ncbi:MAG: NOP5/NOP56 family protein, partial [Thermoplasmatota archaeon]